MKKKILPVIFTDAELDLVKQLLESGGYRSMSEVLRLAIRKMHEKKFPSYMYKKAVSLEEPKLTPEQTCTEVLGGTVIEENGVQYCRIIEGAITTDKPLSSLG